MKRSENQGRKKIPYKDLADLKEDDRIAQIITHMKANVGKVVGVVVDDEPDKPDRYIRKIVTGLPGVMLDYRGTGPVPKTILLRLIYNPPKETK